MENKQGAIKGVIVVVITLAIMIVVFLISNAIEKNLTSNENTTMNAQIKEQILVKKIEVGEELTINESFINVPLSLHYEVKPENATNKSIYIVSSDSSIVRVNDDNTITALAKGEVTLTLVTDDGSNVTTTTKVIVE